MWLTEKSTEKKKYQNVILRWILVFRENWKAAWARKKWKTDVDVGETQRLKIFIFFCLWESYGLNSYFEGYEQLLCCFTMTVKSKGSLQICVLDR